MALALTQLRLALAPLVVALALRGAPGVALAGLLLLGFLSDVFDGVVARRAGVPTAGLRRLDSAVDTVFYLAVAYAAWRLHPAPLRAYAAPIGLLLGAEGLNHAVAFAKFRRETSYHARSARLWGLLLFAALAVLLASGSGALLPAALVAGGLAQLEVLAITLLLPRWRHDVPSVAAAWRFRRADATEVRGAA